MQELIMQLTTENAASALSELAAAARRQADRRQIDDLLGDRTVVTGLLASPSPKVRKNAARLLGALGHAEDAPALANALQAEQTRFVIPSLVLSLGSVGGVCARAALDAFSLPVPADETERKHCDEIAEAFQKARSSLAAADGVPLPVYALKDAQPVLLVSPEGFSGMLCEELRALGYAPQQAANGALVTTDNLQRLYRARCFDEALIVLARNVPLAPDAIARAASDALTLPWRLELRGYSGERAAFVRAVCAGLDAQNSPSRYALELRVCCHGDACDLFLRAASLPDGRFAYRKRAIPASIAPATAACLARLAAAAWQKTHATADSANLPAPHALDPFCGSATLLIELEKHLRCASLTGVDLSPAALAAARENCAAAHAKACLIQKDICKFEARTPHDIVLSNLPFGNRVGNHINNEALYRTFVGRLPDLLAPGGVALLYTMEYRLLSACIRKTPALALGSTLRTEAGGLLPWIFVVKKRS